MENIDVLKIGLMGWRSAAGGLGIICLHVVSVVENGILFYSY